MARFLGSARGRLLAVVDTKATLDEIVAELREAGVGEAAIEVLRRSTAAASGTAPRPASCELSSSP